MVGIRDEIGYTSHLGMSVVNDRTTYGQKRYDVLDVDFGLLKSEGEGNSSQIRTILERVILLLKVERTNYAQGLICFITH